MSYLEVYKKKMQLSGGSICGERKGITEDIMISSFNDDPAYYKGVLKKIDLSETEIEFRMVNTDKSNQKKIYFIPNSSADEGDYIEMIKDDKKVTYIITDFEDNLISRCAYADECNQILKLPSGREYPCVTSNDSYGSKSNINSDFVAFVDTKVKIQVQANQYVMSECMLETRFMFSHSIIDIYKAIDVNNSIHKGLTVMVAKKDEYMEGLDRLEDNYCFQGEVINDVEHEAYRIEGSDTIKSGKEYTYNVSPQEGNIIFELDQYAINGNIAEIISQGNYSCIIKSSKNDELITLNCKLEDEVVSSLDISTVRY